MRIEYDKDVDAAYIYLKYPIKDGEAAKTVNLKENINLDYDKEGRLLGIEILDASKILGKKVLLEAQTA
ncbi:MAG: DUF2283 domain-containing protein [Candidatus Nanoarchaeia archaeon]|nr:DUF2283 domain-containing protein [Candidatus Nanoarchaeia archaeon]